MVQMWALSCRTLPVQLPAHCGAIMKKFRLYKQHLLIMRNERGVVGSHAPQLSSLMELDVACRSLVGAPPQARGRAYF